MNVLLYFKFDFRSGDLSTMAKHNISRMIAIVIALLVFIITMVFSALAAPGICKLQFYKRCFVI